MKKKKVLAPIMFFLGLLILLYPLIAHHVNDSQMSEDIETFQTVTAQTFNRDEMEAYNQTLLEEGGEVTDAFTDEVVSSNPYYGSEAESDGEGEDSSGESGKFSRSPQQAGDATEGSSLPFDFVITIPKINVKIPIYVGATTENLLRGVAQLPGSSLPTGGPGTHSVIAGHRGTIHHRMFLDLNRLKPGDQFHIETGDGRTLVYQVTGTSVVYPHETESLQIQEGKDLVSLVTCLMFPFNDRRLIVYGERVG